MSLSDEDKLMVLQRFVDNLPKDLLVVRDAVAAAPAEAQRLLVGALNYALDQLDIFPDHFQGIGLADDAMVLRLAAKLAVAAGATGEALERLALDANNVISLFGELAAPLEKLVAQLPDREVRGRTVAKILSNKDTRVAFEADIGREAKRHKPSQIDKGDAASNSLNELKKMLETALKRANLM